jgi:hypothetical protein
MARQKPKQNAETPPRIRQAWLYCSDSPKGKVFEGDAIEQAGKDGWVDSPGKITKGKKPKSTGAGKGSDDAGK